MKQLLLDIVPAPAPTFDNMVVGENQAAIEAARTLARGQTLYVWGQAGSGRTHLLRAFAAAHSGSYLHAQRDGTAIAELVDHPPAHDQAIAIDDIDLASDATLTAVFRLYNLWRERGSAADGLSLIVSGHCAPLQMQCREDLRSRLGWGPVYRLMPLSDDQKMAALTRFAAEQGIPLGIEVVRWLLTHGPRDIRILFDWIAALDRYSLTTHRVITLPLLKSMLAEKGLLRP